MQYVFDISDLLTYEEWEELETRAADISNRQHCGVYFALVDDFTDYGDGSVYEVTYQLYHGSELGFGKDRDGIIVLLSMEERDYANSWTTLGTMTGTEVSPTIWTPATNF